MIGYFFLGICLLFILAYFVFAVSSRQVLKQSILSGDFSLGHHIKHLLLPLKSVFSIYTTLLGYLVVILYLVLLGVKQSNSDMLLLTGMGLIGSQIYVLPFLMFIGLCLYLFSDKMKSLNLPQVIFCVIIPCMELTFFRANHFPNIRFYELLRISGSVISIAYIFLVIKNIIIPYFRRVYHSGKNTTDKVGISIGWILPFYVVLSFFLRSFQLSLVLSLLSFGLIFLYFIAFIHELSRRNCHLEKNIKSLLPYVFYSIVYPFYSGLMWINGIAYMVQQRNDFRILFGIVLMLLYCTLLSIAIRRLVLTYRSN